MIGRVLPVALLAFASASGCASNPFHKFYTPVPDDPALAARCEAQKPKPKAVLWGGSSIKRDAADMRLKGYTLLGASSFIAGDGKQKDALRQAKAIGADVVLFYAKYVDTVSGSVPFTVANPPQTMETNTHGTMYGPHGYMGSYYGTSQTTVPGGYTTHQIPYSFNRYEFTATYWAKRGPASVPPEQASERWMDRDLWNALSATMTEAEVIAVLGRPTERRTEPLRTVLQYGKYYVSISTSTGQISQWSGP